MIVQMWRLAQFALSLRNLAKNLPLTSLKGLPGAASCLASASPPVLSCDVRIYMRRILRVFSSDGRPTSTFHNPTCKRATCNLKRSNVMSSPSPTRKLDWADSCRTRFTAQVVACEEGELPGIVLNRTLFTPWAVGSRTTPAGWAMPQWWTFSSATTRSSTLSIT